MNLETKIGEPLWDSIRMNYGRKDYTAAIKDAMYYLSDLLRQKSGAEGDGVALVGQALGGQSPKIKLNQLRSESDWNVQKGVEQIIRGLYQAIRNPRSHEKFDDTEDDALALILFVSYVAKQIDKARVPFSRKEFVARVLEKSFVPNDRYAELLVQEIPRTQLFDVFLDVFAEKESWKPEGLRKFFPALLAAMDEDTKRDTYAVVSDELKRTDRDPSVRAIVGCLGQFVWSHLEEVSRLRVENMLIQSMREGSHDAQANICRGGGLGTWATSIFKQFTLKQDALRAIISKISSTSPHEREYAHRYFWYSMEELADAPPTWFRRILIERLKAGDVEVYNKLSYKIPWEDVLKDEKLTNTIAEFAEKKRANQDDFDDDIPF